jgi:hypothetical protein
VEMAQPTGQAFDSHQIHYPEADALDLHFELLGVVEVGGRKPVLRNDTQDAEAGPLRRCLRQRCAYTAQTTNQAPLDWNCRLRGSIPLIRFRDRRRLAQDRATTCPPGRLPPWVPNS